MTQTALRFPFTKSPAKANAKEQAELKQALSRTSAQLHQAYQCFNTTCEEELVESYIYEISALHARYNYMLRQLKEGTSC